MTITIKAGEKMDTNQEYWQKKTKERALAQFAKVDDLQEQLKKEYEKALSELQKQIADFYMRYAAAAGVPYKDTLLLLNKTEIKGFRNTLEGYLERLVAGDKELKAELATMSIKERITRLDSLMAKIKFECSSLAGYQDEKLGSSLAEICQDNYYRTIFDIQQGLGIGTSFTVLNPKMVQDVIRYPWSGEMFSDRVWNNRQKLVRNLRQELVQGFIQGKSVQGMANALAKSMDSSYKSALSVVWTETAYVVNKSTIMGYEESGVVEEYEFMATLDGRTSSECQAWDGEVFKLSEAKPGVNIPPLHPHCRSTIVPYFGDKSGERIAKLGDNSYTVSKDISYSQWKEAHAEK